MKNDVRSNLHVNILLENQEKHRILVSESLIKDDSTEVDDNV
jgi:hypothetical protein